MVVKAAGAQIGTKCNLTSSGETRYHRLIEAAALKNSWHLGPPDIMSASEGEKGSWKSWHSKGGCINFIIRCISQFQMQTRERRAKNLKFLWTSLMEAPLKVSLKHPSPMRRGK